MELSEYGKFAEQVRKMNLNGDQYAVEIRKIQGGVLLLNDIHIIVKGKVIIVIEAGKEMEITPDSIAAVKVLTTYEMVKIINGQWEELKKQSELLRETEKLLKNNQIALKNIMTNFEV